MIRPSGNGARPDGCTARQSYKDFRRTLAGEWGLISDLSWCDACFQCLRQQYHKSERWQRKKEHAMHQFNGEECFVCPKDAVDVLPPEGHHRTYDHFGYERPDEIVPVCRTHHELYSHEDEYREAAQKVERARMDYADRIVPDHSRHLLNQTLRSVVNDDGEGYTIMLGLARALSFMLEKYYHLYWEYAESHGADRDDVEHARSVKGAVLDECRFPLKSLGFPVDYQSEVPEGVCWDEVLNAPYERVYKWHERVLDRLLSADVIEMKREPQEEAAA